MTYCIMHKSSWKNINFKQTQSVTYGLYCIFLCTHLEGSYPWQMDAAQTKCFCLSGFSPRNLTRMQAPRENPTPMNWWSGKRERRLSNTAAKSPVPPEGGRGAPRCKRRVQTLQHYTLGGRSGGQKCFWNSTWGAIVWGTLPISGQLVERG